MELPSSLFSFQLRPMVFCAVGLSAAAVSSSLLFYRYRKALDRQRRPPRRTDAASQTDSSDGVDQHQDVPSSIPEDQPFTPPCLSGPLARIRESSQDLDWTDKSFACSYENQFSNSQKLVEVKLQHKALYNGLESEHWWVLSNRCYSVFGSELPPQYSGCAYAVACIKRFGTSISEAKVYLHTESAVTSVQNITLQTKVHMTNKCVFIGSDGHSWSHESSNTRILETAAPCVYPTRRPGPPPGF